MAANRSGGLLRTPGTEPPLTVGYSMAPMSVGQALFRDSRLGTYLLDRVCLLQLFWLEQAGL